MKVMETINVVINESSDFDSEKFGEEIPKEILPAKPGEVHEIVEQELPEVIVENMNELPLRKRIVDKGVANCVLFLLLVTS